MTDAPRARRHRSALERNLIILRRQAKRARKTWVNPAYHYRKIKEDLGAAKQGLKVWNLDSLRSDPVRFATAARGKMFATFVLSGACSAPALPIGMGAQAATNNAWIGMGVTILLGHTIANIAFQIIWAVTNRNLYRSHGNFVARLVAMEKDLLPLQWEVIKIATYWTAVAMPLNAVIALAIEKGLPNLIRVVPIGPFMAILDALIFNGPFVRMMGNLYERYSKVLAQRYTGQEVTESLPALNGDATAAVRATLESSREPVRAARESDDRT
jgi:hypothetical protein